MILPTILSGEGSYKGVLMVQTVAEIVRPRHRGCGNEIVAWVPKEPITHFLRADQWFATREKFRPLGAVEFEIDANSGFTVRAPVGPSIEESTRLMSRAFAELGFKPHVRRH